MATYTWVKIGPGNGLLPGGTMPLPPTEFTWYYLHLCGAISLRKVHNMLENCPIKNGAKYPNMLIMDSSKLGIRAGWCLYWQQTDMCPQIWHSNVESQIYRMITYKPYDWSRNNFKILLGIIQNIWSWYYHTDFLPHSSSNRTINVAFLITTIY